MSEFNTLEVCINSLRSCVEMNPALLAQIQKYVNEVEKNPSYAHNIEVKIPDQDYFISICNPSSPKATELFGLEKQLGVCVSACTELLMEDDADEFEDCDLFPWFESDYVEDCEYHNLNLSYDAEAICIAVQYLASHVFGCSANELKFEDHNEVETEPQQTNVTSKNQGCAGMMALMLTVGGAVTYGLVELIATFI